MPIRVFKVNERVFWAGDCTARELLEHLMKEGGLTHKEVTGDANKLPIEMTPQELFFLRFADENDPHTPVHKLQSFQQHLDYLIAERAPFPRFFAAILQEEHPKFPKDRQAAEQGCHV